MERPDLPDKRPGETNKEYFDRIDPGFPEDLARSKPYVKLTAGLLSQMGYFVTDPGTRARSGGMRSDNHDLHVASGWEVKHRRFDFKGLGHFTRRGVDGVAEGSFASIIVDASAPVIRNLTELRSFPRFYWIWAEDMSGLIQVDCSRTYRQWFQQWHWSTLAGRYKPHFMCPLYEFNGLPITKSSMLQSVFRMINAEPGRRSELARLPGVVYRDTGHIENEIAAAKSRTKRIRSELEGLNWLEVWRDDEGEIEEMTDTDPGPPVREKQTRTG